MTPADEARNLRQAAERRVKAATAPGPTGAAGVEVGNADLQRLVHELQVHKVELELQNENLRQAQIDLEESRDRFVELYEFAPVGYLTLSADGHILIANLSATTLLGIERAKLLERSFDRLVIAADVARWRQHLAGVLQQEGRMETDLSLQRGSGSRINVRVNSKRVLKDGQAPTVRVVLTDITQLKVAEYELHQTQRIANMGSWYWDAATDALSASPELYRMFGRDSLPPLAAQRGVLFSNEAWQKFSAAVRGAVRSGSGFDIELPALRADHSEFWIHARSEPVRKVSGKVVGLRGTLQDITMRKQAELDLRLSRKLLELTMQTSQTAGWDFNLADRVLHRTSGHDRIFGYEVAQPTWSYKTFLGHVVAEDRAEVGRQFRHALAARGEWNAECRIRRHDGEVRWILAAGGHHRDDQGRFVRMSGIVRDITEEKALAQVLQEKNEELERSRAIAEKASQAKSEFLSSMSHELRTPLNAILGFAQLMESAAPPPSAAQLRDLQRILGAGWYLLELINEILDLASIESGKGVLTLEPLEMSEVLLECRAMVEPQAEERGIGLIFPSCRPGCCVVADRVRVKQVLLNLMVNAVKYNRPHGTVSVDCSSTTPEWVRINIRDTGDGLTTEQQAQLYQPFNRLGKEGSAEEGTGIGLVVSKRLVGLMGGRIGAESSVGVGSVFWIELPRAAATPDCANPLPVVPAPVDLPPDTKKPAVDRSP